MEGQRYCISMMYYFLHLISHLCVLMLNRPLSMYRKLTATILVGNITELYREAPNITNRLIGWYQSPLVNYHTFHVFSSSATH